MLSNKYPPLLIIQIFLLLVRIKFQVTDLLTIQMKFSVKQVKSMSKFWFIRDLECSRQLKMTITTIACLYGSFCNLIIQIYHPFSLFTMCPGVKFHYNIVYLLSFFFPWVFSWAFVLAHSNIPSVLSFKLPMFLSLLCLLLILSMSNNTKEKFKDISSIIGLFLTVISFV